MATAVQKIHEQLPPRLTRRLEHSARCVRRMHSTITALENNPHSTIPELSELTRIEDEHETRKIVTALVAMDRVTCTGRGKCTFTGGYLATFKVRASC